MKNIFLVVVLSLILAISSCTKTGPTGPTGPAGPISTGTLTGYVSTLDQYGFKVMSDLAGVTVRISDSLGDSTTTDATGKYTFSNLKTGIYNINYAKPGYAPVLAQDFSFLGGGTIVRNANISRYPSFSLFNFTSIDTTIATDPGLIVRGIDSADQVARTYIVFGGTTSLVSAAPGSYAYANTSTIRANSGIWNLFITAQELHDNGLPSGSTAYFVAYPIATGSPTYIDQVTGRTVYTAIGSPTSVLTVIVP